jgi:photosystem II stability/assembly factor-like uncharacterized protein
MKRILLLEFCFLFLATTFQGDRMAGWVQQTIPRQDLPVLDLDFIDSLRGAFVSSKYSPTDSAFIFVTTNGGVNWTTALTENVYLTSIQFNDNYTGYSVGRDVIPINGLIKKSTNGGINWYNCTNIYGCGALMDLHFVNNDTGWVCSTDLTSGGLWRTTSGGTSWQIQMNDSYNPSKVFFVNSSTGWVIGNASHDLYKTTNCGVNWITQYNFTNPITDVYFLNTDTGYIIGGYGNGLIRTTNGGNNWVECNSLPTYSNARIFFINNQRGWIGNRPNNILSNYDGINWGYQYSPLFTSYNVSFVDTLHGWAGYSGLVHTTDGGGPIVSIGNETTPVPKDFALEQNYPNPYNQLTIISYQLSIKSVLS